MPPPIQKPSRELQVSYRLAFERNPLPIWIYDSATLRILAVNLAAIAQYGYNRQEFLALDLISLHQATDVATLRKELSALPVDQGQIQTWRHRRRNGSLIEAETITEVIEHDGLVARMTMVINQIDPLRTRLAQQAQQELADRLSATLENLAVGFVTLDPEWHITFANARAEKMLGRFRTEMLGFSVWDVLPDDAGGIFQVEFARAVAEAKAVRFETFFEPMQVWWEVDVYPSAQGLAVHFRDNSDKHVIQRHLLDEQVALAAVLKSTTDAIVGVNDEGKVILFNPGAERIFGRTQESVQGKKLEMLLPERFRLEHPQQRHDFEASGVPSRMMGLGFVKGLRSDGQELDLEGTIMRVVIGGHSIKIASLRDVSSRVKATADKENSRRQLSDLTKKLMLQEKTLVKRLAQALHDHLGQTVAAIRIVHQTIQARMQGRKVAEIERLDHQMSALINQAMRQIRQVLIELRPPLLEENGLAAALDNELRNRALTQPEIDIAIYAGPEVAQMRWPAEVEYAAFMVAREAVENALRHSGARRVSVRLRGGALSLHLEVDDDGTGILEDLLPRTGHLGILGMQERALGCGATVSVGRSEDNGTRVSFTWAPST
jgi:PAS domain S-box-containing protein